MPFKSKAQARKFEAIAADPKAPGHKYWKAHIEEWRRGTDYDNLPERIDSDEKPTTKRRSAKPRRAKLYSTSPH